MARKILILKWTTLPAISSFTIIEKKFRTATTFFADTEKLVFIPPFLQMCIYDRVSQQTLYFCSLPYWPPCEQLSLGFRITGTYGNVGTPFYCFVPD